MLKICGLAALLATVGACSHVKQVLRDNPRCARMEVFPAAIQPGRPFRMLGPVESGGGEVAERYDELRAAACKLGADAVIAVSDSAHSRAAMYGQVTAPGQVSMYGGGSWTTSSGMAVAYTDGAPAAKN